MLIREKFKAETQMHEVAMKEDVTIEQILLHSEFPAQITVSFPLLWVISEATCQGKL